MGCACPHTQVHVESVHYPLYCQLKGCEALCLPCGDLLKAAVAADVAKARGIIRILLYNYTMQLQRIIPWFM